MAYFLPTLYIVIIFKKNLPFPFAEGLKLNLFLLLLEPTD